MINQLTDARRRLRAELCHNAAAEAVARAAFETSRRQTEFSLRLLERCKRDRLASEVGVVRQRRNLQELQ